jgi:hypothetical protein
MAMLFHRPEFLEAIGAQFGSTKVPVDKRASIRRLIETRP